MLFDMSELPADVTYKILTATVTPRPIAWITTQSPDGIRNAAPFSFFNVMGHEPPTVAIGLLRHPQRGFKDTAQNIVSTGEFVVNLVPSAMADAMNVTCIDAPPATDELLLAGLNTVPSLKVAPPRIADSPVGFECRSIATVLTGPLQSVVIGQVLCAHIAEAFVIDASRGHIDTPALDLIGRMHGSGWYARSTDLFQLTRP
ncbi:flavin reductase family protein [Rhodopseudomonas sp. P2A-2r]|uniref:flavin reductase family protein n=1 Tax=Rhodopseudomonas sp. P2A-2r TaxID=2991972 RepID=UPI002234ACD4|nr:flavin reductase family protein [Rhodopseudomonas sp. P2A-2r]UZE51547.1 flavin reductase family protein [Rhodopseudomonas sp. P2A-2r]